MIYDLRKLKMIEGGGGWYCTSPDEPEAGRAWLPRQSGLQSETQAQKTTVDS